MASPVPVMSAINPVPNPSTNTNTTTYPGERREGAREVAESLLEILLVEATLYRGAASHDAARAYARMEALGYRVGYCLVEK